MSFIFVAEESRKGVDICTCSHRNMKQAIIYFCEPLSLANSTFLAWYTKNL